MRRTKKLAYLLVIATAPLVSRSVWASDKSTPLIQLAILLDTSNSMDGLIGQAKARLWTVVNELVTARREGQRPKFEVALFEYGNSRLPSAEGYIRLVLPLTNDLDKVSEELFALTTRGGDEYCGQVISEAVSRLAWSQSADDLKLIFIAGNEPFTQGQVDYRQACPAAIGRDIVVNTVFCGNHEEGISTSWKDGAILGKGGYMSIDHNQQVVDIEAPQDKELARLGELLNKTYIPYGSRGTIGAANQRAQDVNAAGVSASNAAQRAVTKGSSFYSNAGWDLVDAVEQGAVNLEDIKTEDLPEVMRPLNVEQRKAYVQERAAQRKDLQSKIGELNDQRRNYVARKQRELAESGEANTLDKAMIEMLHDQAAKKKFTFE